MRRSSSNCRVFSISASSTSSKASGRSSGGGPRRPRRRCGTPGRIRRSVRSAGPCRSVTATTLHGEVDRLVGDVRGEHLRHRDLDAGVVAVEFACGVARTIVRAAWSCVSASAMRWRSACLSSSFEPKGLALLEIGLRDVQRPFGHPGVAHAVGESAAAESHLGDLEALAFLADRVLDGDADVVELHFGVAPSRSVMPCPPRRGDVADDIDAISVTRDEDDRGPLVGVGRRGRFGPSSGRNQHRAHRRSTTCGR